MSTPFSFSSSVQSRFILKNAPVPTSSVKLNFLFRSEILKNNIYGGFAEGSTTDGKVVWKSDIPG